jgi:hypothetical protein
MIEIVKNDLEGQFFVPFDSHEFSKIKQISIDNKYDNETNKIIWKLWIRGEKTIWFRADHCFINSVNECEEYCRIQKQRYDDERSERHKLKEQALAKLTGPEREALGFQQ